jgi:hypothetical protein
MICFFAGVAVTLAAVKAWRWLERESWGLGL